MLDFFRSFSSHFYSNGFSSFKMSSFVGWGREFHFCEFKTLCLSQGLPWSLLFLHFGVFYIYELSPPMGTTKVYHSALWCCLTLLPAGAAELDWRISMNRMCCKGFPPFCYETKPVHTEAAAFCLMLCKGLSQHSVCTVPFVRPLLKSALKHTLCW